MREKGQADNDLVARLQGDERLGLAPGALDGLLADPLSFTGAASAQVAAVVARVVGDHGRPSRGGGLHPGIDPVKLLHSGKVRDVYADGDDLVLVASDRVSIYDVVLPTAIPDKGAVLTRLSLWWFDRLGDLVPNHVISGDDVPPEFAGRAMRCRRLEMLPVECVARGYLTGGGLKDYEKTGAVSGRDAAARASSTDRSCPSRSSPRRRRRRSVSTTRP